MDLNGKFHRCGAERQYSEYYDVYYCRVCDEWLESKCGDASCEFCQNRPEKPSLVDDSDKLK